jgi:hypothetical protein
MSFLEGSKNLQPFRRPYVLFEYLSLRSKSQLMVKTSFQVTPNIRSTVALNTVLGLTYNADIRTLRVLYEMFF